MADDQAVWGPVIVAFSIAILFVLLPIMIFSLYLGIHAFIGRAYSLIFDWSYLSGLISCILFAILTWFYRKIRPKRIIRGFLRH